MSNNAQTFDTPNKLKNYLRGQRAMNVLSGGAMPNIPKDLGWGVSEVCAHMGYEVEFTLRKMK